MHQIHENLPPTFLSCTKFIKICGQFSCLKPNSSKSAASFLVFYLIHQNLRPAFLFCGTNRSLSGRNLHLAAEVFLLP
ncbi:hypothetical protein NC99_43050 [Sunxiuqinia dokdonensis]|uniref:Uncharacterized protein n=1 Tax=Sunxiuqinia dokdonensis TaxID=1409788 RepID=A0A0L8V3R3_9BACT|nr:hypothetical protein NC99_43050 [Sunxiuqinia dokdonensis]